MKEILTASEASRIMGCAPQKVREHIKRGIWDFGERIPKKVTGSKRGDEYNIYRAKFEKHIGRKLTEEDLKK